MRSPATTTDALSSAIAYQTADVIRTAQAVQQAAAGEDVSTLHRAEALVELAAVAGRLDDLLDRLHGFQTALSEDAG